MFLDIINIPEIVSWGKGIYIKIHIHNTKIEEISHENLGECRNPNSEMISLHCDINKYPNDVDFMPQYHQT